MQLHVIFPYTRANVPWFRIDYYHLLRCLPILLVVYCSIVLFVFEESPPLCLEMCAKSSPLLQTSFDDISVFKSIPVSDDN